MFRGTSFPRRWTSGSVRATLLVSLCVVLVLAAGLLFRGARPAKALPSSGIVWSDEEISRMPAMVLLKAGQTLDLLVASNASSIDAGGTWSARWGSITDSGTYTAPVFTPPSGTDTITYTGPDDGPFVNLTIRILPNPDIPGSESTPYVQAPWALGGSECTEGCSEDMSGSNQASGEDGSGGWDDPSQDLPELQPGVPNVVVGLNQQPASPVAYNSVQDLSVETTGDDNFYRLPLERYPLAYSPIAARVVSGQDTLQWARETPTYSPEILQSRQTAETCQAEPIDSTQQN